MRQATWAPEGGVSRRRLLRRSGAALATAAGAASAGCLNFLPPASQQARYGPVDVPTDRLGDRPTYRKWFPAESALPDLGRADGYDDGQWMYVTPDDLGAETFGRPFDIGRGVLQASMDYVGYGIREFDSLVGVDPVGTVATGSIDRERVRDTIEATPYEPAGYHRSFDVYDRDDLERLLAVGDDALVQTRRTNRREKAEAIIDAAGGHVQRRHETDDAFQRFTSFVGTAPTIMDAFGLLSGALADALWYTFDDSSVYYVHDHLFPQGGTPDEGTVKRTLSEFSRNESASKIDVTIDAPRVTVAWQLDEAAFELAEPYRSAPFATWAVDDGADAVTIRHAAGEPIPVEHLQIHPREALREPPAADSALEAGDELVFERPAVDDRRIELAFEQSEDSTVLLFDYDPTQNDTTT